MSPPSSVPGSSISTSSAWAGTRPRAAAAMDSTSGRRDCSPRPGHHEQRRPAAGIVRTRQGQQHVGHERRVRVDRVRAAAPRPGRRQRRVQPRNPGAGRLARCGSMRCRSGCSDSASRNAAPGARTRTFIRRIVRVRAEPDPRAPVASRRHVRCTGPGRGRPLFMSYANPRSVGRPSECSAQAWGPQGPTPIVPTHARAGKSGVGGDSLSVVLPGRSRPRQRGLPV